MQLYTIINDRTKWANNLNGLDIFKVKDYSKEEADEFLKSVDGFIRGKRNTTITTINRTVAIFYTIKLTLTNF